MISDGNTKTQKALRARLGLPYDLTIQDVISSLPYTLEELTSVSRKQELVICRQVIHAYFHSVGCTVTWCASLFNQNHATVIHSCRKTLNALDVGDVKTVAMVSRIKNNTTVSRLKRHYSKADRLMSKYYTINTGLLLDVETKERFSWVADAIEEALNN